ncbi:LytR/AlgR family response regulator transcription factor [Peptacetobacter hiranonis]|uniref:LytR/AlgR family response regulator transcription factor n=1 Tax=Peptacetobacter hiranonis TaxID=89152 RepID=UPI0022E1001A|nr:LytTR family DNA-binding domain-containing protein [Peptacetobacter hiranonis]
MSIGNLLAFGAEAIKAWFKDGVIMPAFDLEEPNFYEIETGSEDQLMVLGEYMLYADKESEMSCIEKQRATFCYRKESDGYKLYHMHVSNEYNELVGDEVFPVQVTRQTYQYVQRLLKEGGRTRGEKIAVKENNGISFVNCEMIEYIEAIERNCVLHMVNENRHVKVSIGDIENQLPPYFYRLHRSYYVNCHYVSKIERYKLTMITGEKLPVPKVRYMEIREDIKAILAKKEEQE